MSDLSVSREPTVPLDEPSLVQYKLCYHHKREFPGFPGKKEGVLGETIGFPKREGVVGETVGFPTI